MGEYQAGNCPQNKYTPKGNGTPEKYDGGCFQDRASFHTTKKRRGVGVKIGNKCRTWPYTNRPQTASTSHLQLRSRTCAPLHIGKSLGNLVVICAYCGEGHARDSKIAYRGVGGRFLLAKVYLWGGVRYKVITVNNDSN